MPRYESRSQAEAASGGYHDQWHDIEARGRIRERVEKQLDLDKSIKLLYKVTGLTKNNSLYSFFREKLTKLGAETYQYENGKLQAYTGLMGLVMYQFYNVDLPLPKKLRHYSIPEVYSLAGEIYPWNQVDVASWNKEYDDYCTDWIRLKEGHKQKYDPQAFAGHNKGAGGAYFDIYFDKKWSLRLDLAKDFAEVFFKRLQELLKFNLKKASTVEALTRNVELRQLVSECNRYPVSLSGVMFHSLKDRVKELKASDPLTELCVKVILNALYSSEFNLDEFNQEVIEIYWGQLFDLAKDENQKKIIEILKSEISEVA
jgi:hypothetical protein